jgi:hypothetical protein
MTEVMTPGSKDLDLVTRMKASTLGGLGLEMAMMAGGRGISGVTQLILKVLMMERATV